jgi:chemotaxis protein MotB
MDDEYESDGRKRMGTVWLGVLLALAGAGAGIALWYLWHRLEDERAASARGQKVAAELAERVAAAEALTGELKAKLTAAEAEAIAARARAEELSTEVREKDSELQKLKGTFAALEDKLRAEIKKGEIHLTQVGGRIQVDLVDKILFDSGKAELSNRGKDVLSRVGSILTDVGERQLQVSGHTDDSPIAEPLRGTFASNWELSAARAVNVVRYLEETAKIPGRRLVAAGYGQFHPVADNVDGAGRARNRRIEILLTPALTGKPVAASAAPAGPPAARTQSAASGPAAAKPVSKQAKAAPGKAIAKRPAKRK